MGMSLDAFKSKVKAALSVEASNEIELRSADGSLLESLSSTYDMMELTAVVITTDLFDWSTYRGMPTSRSKALICGDGAIGKTTLLACLTNSVIDWDDDDIQYEPTTFNNFQLEWETPGSETELDLELWDTAGQEGFEQLRQLSYPGTDIFLVAYSTNSIISLNNVEHKWLPELMQSTRDYDM